RSSARRSAAKLVQDLAADTQQLSARAGGDTRPRSFWGSRNASSGASAQVADDPDADARLVVERGHCNVAALGEDERARNPERGAGQHVGVVVLVRVHARPAGVAREHVGWPRLLDAVAPMDE